MENNFTWTLCQLSHIWLDHALWLMVLSFRCGILSLEVDKRLAVTLLQESCGLCKWHRDRHSERGFGWRMRNSSASRHHDTVACTLQQEERDEEGRMHVLVVARVANKIPHACKECRQRVGRDAASSGLNGIRVLPGRHQQRHQDDVDDDPVGGETCRRTRPCCTWVSRWSRDLGLLSSSP